MCTPGEAVAPLRTGMLAALADDQLGKALFNASRVSIQGQKARKLANKGTWVVMDSYWSSTVAYAITRGVEADLDALTPAFTKPDLTLMLTLNEQQRQVGLRLRGMTAEDNETLNSIFRNRVTDELAARCQLQIDVSGLSEEDALEHLMEALQPFLQVISIGGQPSLNTQRGLS
jgi:dTMP kinase